LINPFFTLSYHSFIKNTIPELIWLRPEKLFYSRQICRQEIPYNYPKNAQKTRRPGIARPASAVSKMVTFSAKPLKSRVLGDMPKIKIFCEMKEDAMHFCGGYDDVC